jgi:glutamate racemase
VLGIFDSGLGGLTVLRTVRARLPAEDLVYFADQAHVPYGDRDDADLARLFAHALGELEAAGVDAVVMGCNTSCAVASRVGWPRAARVPILDIIASAAAAIASDTTLRRIGVVATAATARSGAYGTAIRARSPHLDVVEAAAPELVPLVESGVLSGPEVEASIARACATFGGPVDAVVLACTHYPLVESAFATVLGAGVHRIDPALVQAERATDFARGGTGRTHFLTTGDVAPFERSIRAILGPAFRIDDVAQAKLPSKFLTILT